MGGPGGILKHLVWIAPLTIFILWYISQQQRAQDDDMKESTAKFDEDFARMSEGLATGSAKQEWRAEKKSARERREIAHERSVKSSEKADTTFEQMEAELNNAEFKKEEE